MDYNQSKEAYDKYLKDHTSNVKEAYYYLVDIDNGIIKGLFSEDSINIASALVDSHDNSKLSEDEYDGYRQYFNPTIEEVVSSKNGKPVGDREKFKLAWLHHGHHNPHHWEYWTLLNEDEPGTVIALEMPDKYILEMLSDWMSFSIAKGNPTEVVDWYKSKRNGMILHENTRKKIEEVLKRLAKLNDTEVDFTESVNGCRDELNPKLFEGNKLKPEVRDKLLEIRDEFLKGLEEEDIPIRVIDSVLVGSNVSYNYTDMSDLDLHIIADLSSFKGDDRLLRLLYDYYKSLFNKDYDINVKGINVEVYIEDMNSTTISNGIYSLDKDEWVKEPRKDYCKYVDISKDLEPWNGRYNSVISRVGDETAQDLLDSLYMLRKVSLSSNDEFGVGNLIFKEFRNLGYIDRLKQIIKDDKSKELSMEGLDKGTGNHYIRLLEAG